MNIQVQKEVEAASGEALSLVAFCAVLDLTTGRKVPARRAVRALASAIAEISHRVDHEPARVAGIAAAKRRARLERHRVCALNDGHARPALSKEQGRTLKEADALEARGLAVLTKDRDETTRSERRAAKADVAKARAMRKPIESELAQTVTVREDHKRLAEAADLDAEREDVEAGKVIDRARGQVRIRTRDGLKLLHERGAFTPRDDAGKVRADQAARIEADRMLAIGLRYRERYEMSQASLRSCLGSSDRVAVQRNVYIDARAAQRRAALANRVRQLDIAVSVRLGPDALEALRMVAGEARTLRSITTSSRHRERLADGLTSALKLIGSMLEIAA